MSRSRGLASRGGRIHFTLRPGRLLPSKRLSTLGFDAGRFPPTPPACYPAPWRLPGPDFHRHGRCELMSGSGPRLASPHSERWAHTRRLRSSSQPRCHASPRQCSTVVSLKALVRGRPSTTTVQHSSRSHRLGSGQQGLASWNSRRSRSLISDSGRSTTTFPTRGSAPRHWWTLDRAGYRAGMSQTNADDVRAVGSFLPVS